MAKARAKKAVKKRATGTTARKRTVKSSTAARRKTSRRASPAKTSSRKATAARTRRKRGATAARMPKKRATSTRSRLSTAAQAVGVAVKGTVATLAAHAPWAAAGTDAIELLERDHRRLEELLARGEDTTARAVKGRTALLETIMNELTAHELVEEQLLYPALKSHPEARDIVLEGYQEHHVADLIAGELQGLPPSDERWGAKFKVLKENLEHHIEEEEGEMFRTARAVMTRDELRELGAAMQTMKADALGR